MKTLVIVDLQNDFLNGGSLEIPNANEIIKPINDILDNYDLIVATKDWHPENHLSFSSNHEGKRNGDTIRINCIKQVLWPNHCIQDSDGSNFPVELDSNKIDKVIYKGMDSGIDSYSGFFDNAKNKSTGLSEFLKEKKVEKIDCVGLATEYCLKLTALDSVSEGFYTRVITKCIRGIDSNDCRFAFEEMRSQGIVLI